MPVHYEKKCAHYSSLTIIYTINIAELQGQLHILILRIPTVELVPGNTDIIC
jgi:hypothetical protein